jgi:hypothetical protein
MVLSPFPDLFSVDRTKYPFQVNPFILSQILSSTFLYPFFDFFYRGSGNLFRELVSKLVSKPVFKSILAFFTSF